jgi:hypothetical protein
MSDKLPIVDQLHNANDDRGRADVLLRCPDALLLKYEGVFLNACREFPAGELFVLHRTIAMRHVRSAAGGLPGGLALELETLRAELVAYAAGAPVAERNVFGQRVCPGCGCANHDLRGKCRECGAVLPAEPLWPLDAPQAVKAAGPPSLDI